MYKKLSILVPVYNEKKTITECINNILKSDTLNLEKEIIISDNNSNDGTQEILKQIVHPNVKVIYRNKNDGKGANLRNALGNANGDLVIFQDADLEYSPNNYINLIKPFYENNADVVYGSRLTGARLTKITGFPNFIANKIITFS